MSTEEIHKEWPRATPLLVSLVYETLDENAKIPSERIFVQRIFEVLSRGEIIFVESFPDESKEAVAIKLAKLEGAEEMGFVVFLVVKEGWIDERFESKGNGHDSNILYENLKTALQFIDKLK
ncbi:unnamed protein product, partial [marine sediment metagenome]